MPEQHDEETRPVPVATGLRARREAARRQQRSVPPPVHTRPDPVKVTPLAASAKSSVRPIVPAQTAATEPASPLQTTSSFSALIEKVAPNPRNTRDIASRPERLASLRASLRELGQMQPSACVTRSAYLAIFPEDEEAVSPTFDWVQVGGGRRRAALLLEGKETIEVRVRDSLAASRVSFIRAMADENLEDETLDPVEEALVVKQLLTELKTGNAVAELMDRTPGWVSQRKNVLLLQPEVQAQMRESGEARLSLDEVRKGKWHELSRDQQLANLQVWRRRRGLTNEEGESTPPPAPRPRMSRVRAAIQRLGETPAAIAETLRSELSAEQRRELAEALLRD
ncbi:ParB/RepB/Spo0J family partition protein [Couchioplanes azureus]|uniref:ParB/RepB/Spo0J family partition protein n=1 Tax=Couchioplanes caeruleus TaxID=56438 RepID=UPI00167167C2|nr:plasmid partitioning protein [Couchioplanes caeruleus]GGQ85920.1 hypothetical protein GCM10010166_65130 [Couchioplanes caeruleus subsp. azureus]